MSIVVSAVCCWDGVDEADDEVVDEQLDDGGDADADAHRPPLVAVQLLGE
jgi:hypothetical protein